MSEFNSVNSQNYDTNSAFADAVQRARQVSFLFINFCF